MVQDRSADAGTSSVGDLSIGDLAEATGVSVPTLRMWEQRHGFPVARRLPSGHRRYDATDVEQVRQVLVHRRAGLRLDRSISRVQLAASPPSASVFTELRNVNGALPVHRLSKRTLLGMSWAIEDEFMARARRPHLYGAFQRAPFYAAAEARWTDLARRAATTIVFADFPDSDPPAEAGTVRRVELPEVSPLRSEWAVVCDAEDLCIALSAWEIPGQADVPDPDREFEAVWSLRPADVATAALVCATAAGESATLASEGALLRAVRPDPRADAEWAAAEALFARMVAYVGRRGR
ncbi:MAG TPA: DICT sensory domain-containing protein [Nocardioides sp.]